MGIISEIARRLQCSRTHVYRLLDKFSTFRDAIDDEKYGNRDLARTRLLQKINDGNLRAIMYYLDRTDPEFRPKSSQEVSGPDGQEITVKVVRGVSYDDL